MKNLKDYISEGNINNNERKYREFLNFCAVYKVSPEEVTIQRTARNNWKVMKDGKKIFLVSNYILNQDIIDQYNLKSE